MDDICAQAFVQSDLDEAKTVARALRSRFGCQSLKGPADSLTLQIEAFIEEGNAHAVHAAAQSRRPTYQPGT